MRTTHITCSHILTLLLIIAKMRDTHPSVSMIHAAKQEVRD